MEDQQQPTPKPEEEIIAAEPVVEPVAEPFARADQLLSAEAPSAEEGIDPQLLQAAYTKLASEQNFIAALIAGFFAALVGAAIWAVITGLIGYQIGWLAVGVGALVGMAIRAAGKGLGKKFGVLGAIYAMAGCLLGNLLTVVYIDSVQAGLPFTQVLSQLNPVNAIELMASYFHPMDFLFYGIALYEGYKLSFRQITEDELVEAIKAGAQGV